MKFEDLEKFIEWEDKRIKKYYKNRDIDKKTRILGRTVKINEEIGELCDVILSELGLQRKEKLKKYNHNNKEKLEKEFADVILTVLLLSKEMDIDIAKSLQNKIKIIKKRKY